ncbi:MAG: hypothetical protein GC153_08495 [Alphaproteobacteria bacterium]|nr:hypothetical protein [Alphaproteobacteria bacterium]
MCKRISAFSGRYLTFAGLIFGLTVLVVNAPAAILPALARSTGVEFYVDDARGTLWRGELKGVRSKGVKIGDIEFRTHPADLLRGRITADLVSRNGALAGAGRAVVLANGLLKLEHAHFVFNLDAANEYLILGEPLSGKVEADIKELAIAGSGCIRADAKLWTDVLARPARRFDGEAVDLFGGGACAGKDLVVALSGASSDGAVKLTLRVTPQLTYTLLAQAAPARTDIANALHYLGFQRSEGEMSMATSGIIRTVGS